MTAGEATPVSSRPRQRAKPSTASLAGLSGDWHDRFEADSARAAIAKQIASRLAETSAAIELLEARYDGVGATPTGATTRTRRPVKRLILELMTDEPSKVWSSTTLAETIGVPVETVRGTLRRLVSDGQVNRPASGVYSLHADSASVFPIGGDGSRPVM